MLSNLERVCGTVRFVLLQLFVTIGPVAFFQFGLAFCISAFFVYFVLLIIGSQTPKHLGTYVEIDAPSVAQQLPLPRSYRYFWQLSWAETSILKVHLATCICICMREHTYR